MSERVAITGASGFLGRHLSERVSRNHVVLGVGSTIDHSRPPEQHVGPHLDRISEEINSSGATVVIHAGFANRKPERWSDAEYLADSVVTATGVADAAEAIGARLVLIGSSAVYGRALSGEIMTEQTPLAPVSLYGSAKAVQEMALASRRPGGVPVTVMRLFNLIGPGQKVGMLVPDWILQAQAVLEGSQREMRIGHARSGRDFVDVRDAADAIALAIDAPVDPWPVYNVCSGRVTWLAELLATITELAGGQISVVETSAALADDDVQVQVGSYGRLAGLTGWQATRDANCSVRDAWHQAQQGG